MQLLPPSRRTIKIVMYGCFSWLLSHALQQLLRSSLDSSPHGSGKWISICIVAPLSGAQSALTGALWLSRPPTDILNLFRHELQYQHLVFDHHCGREGGEVIQCGG